jgi:hypothetical protein
MILKTRTFNSTEKGTAQPFYKFIWAVNAISPNEFAAPEAWSYDGDYAEVYSNFIVRFRNPHDRDNDGATISATTEHGVQLMNQIPPIDGEV